MLSLYVVLKFIHKPLRFFGTIGVPILLIGSIFTGDPGISRLFFGVPLADRPALILGALLIVLGIQVIALGLIGEIIIFVAGKRIKDYTIDRILSATPALAAGHAISRADGGGAMRRRRGCCPGATMVVRARN